MGRHMIPVSTLTTASCGTRASAFAGASCALTRSLRVLSGISNSLAATLPNRLAWIVTCSPLLSGTPQRVYSKPTALCTVLVALSSLETDCSQLASGREYTGEWVLLQFIAFFGTIVLFFFFFFGIPSSRKKWTRVPFPPVYTPDTPIRCYISVCVRGAALTLMYEASSYIVGEI
jgi:hypothetical protein